MRRLGSLALLLIAALVLSGCATMRIGSYVGRGIDFRAYQTWDWGPADALPTGDPRLDNNAFFADHFEGAVEKNLAARGYARAAASPDLLVHYHASIAQRMDIDAIDRQQGYCFDEGCDPRVFVYEAGTLIIDIVDARTHRLLWRGWAEDNVEPALENQDLLERQIDRAVTGMLAKLPGRF